MRQPARKRRNRRRTQAANGQALTSTAFPRPRCPYPMLSRLPPGPNTRFVSTLLEDDLAEESHVATCILGGLEGGRGGRDSFPVASSMTARRATRGISWPNQW